LGIVDGANPPAVVVDDDLFMENFLVLIGTDYYAISQIDGTTITLNGPMQNWGLLTSGGTAVQFMILKYTKEAFSVPEREEPPMSGYDFRSIDRRGTEIINLTVDTGVPFIESPLMLSVLNKKDKDAIIDTISQTENVSLKIDWFDD
jgi:hypothetical protein